MFRLQQHPLHVGKEYMVKYFIIDKDDEIKVTTETDFLYRHHLTDCDLDEIEKRLDEKFERKNFFIEDQIVVYRWCSFMRNFIGALRIDTSFIGEHIREKIRRAMSDPNRKVIIFVETL